ncbi:RNA polymerase sigma-I factor [Psychrobacillus lasiicapitis]|uniref:RNA polymerase sigma factor SigI n=1 Tax=Psychrobacillus lasiicapitis TaxID=1636719 RepID=A0A544TBS8_9BACI|nr:RNA polymerase sigma-I factor [Psychrobacillus lasiicapitis]TQR14915.1 RNA polymerase sigma-I factor [Psychrobacillus lasiicapitis]GGA21015.1 RNA polymerase sigma factor SigI [Psychrobacillus lasiicapitis]
MLLSIIQGLFKTKTKQTMNELAYKAKAGDEEVLSDLLFAFTPFIKKTATFICKRPIDEHDEEFSIAMNGFHEALKAFDSTKDASLQTFAHLIIKRRMVDFIRKEAIRNEKELFMQTNEEAATTEQHFLLDKQSIDTHIEEQRSATRREELIRYSELLATFNLSFDELTKVAPKHADARKTAFQIAQIVAETEEFYDHLMKTKQLPLKEIEAIVEVSRKTLERHRKYMIAVVLLLNSDFVYIKEYVKGEII